ncbi:transposase [Streptomyces sp. NPDC056470]|uniref:transposase n=1 Tax=Streptomyces sp. NPDC056470 TaxID=3345831 RepID=UPI0036B8094E
MNTRPAPVPTRRRPSRQGGRTARTAARNRRAASARPPGGGGAAGEALGRSRGWFTPKLHLSADGRCRPLTLIVTTGQRADCTQFPAVPEKIPRPETRAGQAPQEARQPSADKAHSNGPFATTCDNAASGTPSRRRPTARPSASAEGHAADGHRRYRKRSTVERAINRLRNARAAATRYGKRGYVYPCTATAAALVIWFRT